MTNRLNADFSQRIVIRPEDYHWVESPMTGVKRMMLDRIGDKGHFKMSTANTLKAHGFAAHT